MIRSWLISLLFFLVFGVTSDVDAQNLFDDFRSLEERVKYTAPDSLRIFSKSLDTTNTIEHALKYWSKGKYEFWQSNYTQAYVELEKALKIIEKIDEPTLLAELYLDLSSSLAVVDKTGKALSFLLEANALFEKHGNKEQRSRAAISLGEMHRKIGDYETAIKVLRQALNQTQDNTYNRARCLNRMAAVFSETNKKDSSLYYSYQSLELSGSINEPDLIATSHNEIGYVLRNQNKYEEALPHFFLADSLWKSVGMLSHAINSMHHISIIYGATEQIEKGLSITHKAYSLAKGKGWYQIETSLMEDLKSFHHYLKNDDSLLYYDRERLQAVVNWRAQKHEVNTKMVEILFTQKENEQTINEQKIRLKNEALEKEAINRERTFLLITVTLIGLILFIIFIYANQQRKLKRKLAKENEKKELKNKQLTAANIANEALVQEISHRVKNNLAVLSGLLRMQATRSENKQVIKELNDSILRIESIATIHKKLYDKRSDAKVNLKEALSELSVNILTAMGKSHNDCLKTQIDVCEIDIADAVTLCLILNEVITNSCKYGNVSPENKLSIELENSEEGITCQVIDQGPGFDIDKIDQDSKSLGVYLIKLLAKQLNAKISWIKTKENFIFRIHLKKDE